MNAPFAPTHESVRLIRPADAGQASRIEAFLAAHPRATPFHRPAWLAAVAEGTGNAALALVAERDGAGLLPELDYKPVNRYLPPRETPPIDTRAVAAAEPTFRQRLAKMVNRVVSI